MEESLDYNYGHDVGGEKKKMGLSSVFVEGFLMRDLGER